MSLGTSDNPQPATTTSFLLWTGDADHLEENADTDEHFCWRWQVTWHELDPESIHINRIVQPFLIIVAAIRTEHPRLPLIHHYYVHYLRHCEKFRIFKAPESCLNVLRPYAVGTSDFRNHPIQCFELDLVVAEYTQSYLDFYTERNIFEFDGSARYWDYQSDDTLGDARVVPERRRYTPLSSD